MGGNGHWGHCDPQLCPISDEPNAAPTNEEDEDESSGGSTRTHLTLEEYRECKTTRGENGEEDRDDDAINYKQLIAAQE